MSQYSLQQFLRPSADQVFSATHNCFIMASLCFDIHFSLKKKETSFWKECYLNDRIDLDNWEKFI